MSNDDTVQVTVTLTEELLRELDDLDGYQSRSEKLRDASRRLIDEAGDSDER